MIFLYDGPKTCKEIGERFGFQCGRLFQPRSGFSPERDPGVFAIDNYCFSNPDMGSYWRMLERLKTRLVDCKFVSCPDVVGSARRTLELFHIFREKLIEWPIALVAQDGIEDLEIPWHLIDAIFIGGTNKFKLSDQAVHVIKAAQILGKWTHVGRINSKDRWDKFEALGVDSCDGSGLSRYSEAMVHAFIEPQLPLEVLDA